jgi:hypothetical protein
MKLYMVPMKLYMVLVVMMVLAALLAGFSEGGGVR